MVASAPLNKIALIRIGKIGDLIVTNFAIRKMRLAFPHARILLVTSPINRELLKYSKDVDEVFYFRKGIDVLRLILKLQTFRADMLMDFNDNRSSTSTAILRFGGAKEKVGFVFGNQKWLTIPVDCPSDESTHISERLRLLPEAIGLTFEDSEIRPSLTLGDKELIEVQRHLREANPHGQTVIAVNISAGNPNRYWQTEKWRLLIEEIHLSEPSSLFLLLCAPLDISLAKEIGGLRSDLIFPAHTTFHHFAAYISSADILISPDTSAIHIACAFRIPLVGLYPAVEWNFQRWRPLGTPSESVRPKDGLVPDIQAEQVIDAYTRLRRQMEQI